MLPAIYRADGAKRQASRTETDWQTYSVSPPRPRRVSAIGRDDWRCTMTPLQAARALCANYQPDGSCLGIVFTDDLKMCRFRKERLPCLLQSCQACPYFEEIVLPQVSSSVAEQYRKSLPAGTVTSVRPQRSIKLCRDCQKREVEPRKRYCATCAKIRKRRRILMVDEQLHARVRVERVGR